MGIPIPDCVFVPKLNNKKIKAGTNIPPKAPEIGKIASLNFDNSPLYTSRSNSNPIIKKKIAINPSLIQCSKLWFAMG